MMHGYIALTISGKFLDFDEISKNISLEPIKTVKKGQRVHLNMEVSEEQWIYKINFLDEDFTNKINCFLMNINSYKNYIYDLLKTKKVELNCYLNSEMGQFGFTLTVEQIIRIQQLGLNINFHILSYGLVE